MPDRAVRESSHERGSAERAVHQAEIGGAPECLADEHRHHDWKRRVEEVRDQNGDDESPHEPTAPDEAQPFRELRQIATRGLGVRDTPRSRHEGADERRGDEEACCVEPEGRCRAELCDENSADGSSDEPGALLDRAADPICPFHPNARALDEIGKEGNPCGRSGSVEESTEEDKDHELPEL
jgi:hypothetical protein